MYAAGVRAGQTAVVYGAGGVGSNAVQGARYAGARTSWWSTRWSSSGTWRRFGATHTFADAKAAHDFVVETTHGQLADHAIITVGILHDEVIQSAIEVVGKTGQVTITAVGNASVHVHAGLLIGTSGGCRAPSSAAATCSTTPRLLGLYRSGDLKLDELITRQYRLDEVNQGYQDMLDGKNIRGVIIHEH